MRSPLISGCDCGDYKNWDANRPDCPDSIEQVDMLVQQLEELVMLSRHIVCIDHNEERYERVVQISDPALYN